MSRSGNMYHKRYINRICVHNEIHNAVALPAQKVGISIQVPTICIDNVYTKTPQSALGLTDSQCKTA
jgi:hypothetical protein